MNTQELIKSIETKFKDVNQKMDALIKGAIAEPIGLLSEYDILTTLKIEQVEYEFIKEFSKSNLTGDEMNLMREISSNYYRKVRMIDLANEKIILSNPKLTNKNTMTYLLSKSAEDTQTNNVTININVDNRFEKIDLQKLGVVKDGKDNQ